MSSTTIEQEGWVEGEYNDFFAALSEENVQECRTIIEGVRAKEFFNVADDMSKLLAVKSLNS